MDENAQSVASTLPVVSHRIDPAASQAGQPAEASPHELRNDLRARKWQKPMGEIGVFSPTSGSDRLPERLLTRESRRAPPRRLPPIVVSQKAARSVQSQTAVQELQGRNTGTMEICEQLLDEFSYRLKTNQEILLDLVERASRKTENLEARELLSDTSRRIGAVGAAQQVFYSAGSSTDASGQTFIEAICANARASVAKGVSISCERTNGCLPKETMIPLALVLNELITNAARFGMDDHGRVVIKVGLSYHAGLHELYVQDGGPGFDFDEAAGSSGLGLVTMLARRLSGALTVERRSGARCTLRFRDQ